MIPSDSYLVGLKPPALVYIYIYIMYIYICIILHIYIYTYLILMIIIVDVLKVRSIAGDSCFCSSFLMRFKQQKCWKLGRIPARTRISGG